MKVTSTSNQLNTVLKTAEKYEFITGKQNNLTIKCGNFTYSIRITPTKERKTGDISVRNNGKIYSLNTQDIKKLFNLQRLPLNFEKDINHCLKRIYRSEVHEYIFKSNDGTQKTIQDPKTKASVTFQIKYLTYGANKNIFTIVNPIAIGPFSKRKCVYITAVFQKEFISEIDLLHELSRCPYIVPPPMAIFKDNIQKICAIQKCFDCDLFTAIEKKAWKITQTVTLKNISKVSESVLHALQYIHSRMIVQRDMKSENVFLKYDSKNPNLVKKVVLADFDLACKNNKYNSEKVVGTYGYMSPEIASKLQYSSKSDMWAFGVLVYEMLFQKPPRFLPKNENEIFSFLNTISQKLIDQCLFPKQKKTNNVFVTKCRNAITQCLQFDPKKRPSAAKLLPLF